MAAHMSIQKIALLFTCLLQIYFSKAQCLNIGDPVPDLKLEVSNYFKNNLSFSELKGKLVILDFWSHICVNCIKSFPLIDSLQKQFAGRIQIILVNQESKPAK